MTDYISKLLNGQPVQWRTLGEVCDTITDFTAAGSFASNAKNVEYLSTPDFAQLIRTTDLKAKFVTSKGNVYVSESAYKYLWRVVLDQESIILPNVGNCGEVYYVKPEDLPHEHNVLGPNALLVRSNTCVNKFLYYLFQCEPFQFELKKITSSTGQTKFNKTNLKKLTIPIPPLAVQRRIVEILDVFSALTAELEGRRKQYAYYRERLLTLPDAPRLPLGEVCAYAQPTPYLVKSNLYKDSYPTPVLTAGKTFILGYTNETEGIYPASKSPTIIFDDFTTACRWVDFDFKAKSSAMKMLTSRDESKVLLKYIYYWLSAQPSGLVDSDHKRQWISNYAPKPIPIPPMEEQRRIVEVLDRFSTLCESLTEGLPREIELRRKQYGYYRKKLLTFK